MIEDNLIIKWQNEDTWKATIMEESSLFKESNKQQKIMEII